MGEVVRMKERREREGRLIQEIRNPADGGFFFVDHEFFDGYAEGLGTACTLIYMVLCRYAGADQACFPSVDLIGRKAGVSSKTVMRGIKELESRGLIKVGRERGQPNLYTLLSKRVWGNKALFGMTGQEPVNVFEGFIGMCGSCASEPDGCSGCIGGMHWVEKLEQTKAVG